MRYDFTRLDALLRRFASETVPSCACAVMKDGQLLYEGYYGYSDLEAKTPVTSASLYRQASMTKLVTYTIMMILLEQGRTIVQISCGEALTAEQIGVIRNKLS